ncbi:signal peptidase II [Corynebacterium sp. TAE3-ERU12]|uniref:signal peptidase II n=1 Tax=Corynebacterium sp. TAE3-ERU12 TaxID=2849491 RepID=UPI001C459837|nr:signal peptidase II [Corynebacterium sp. TAE3-ERU12]MBV7296206.1 signal peptidase II [Corynebacterium sp. TAE3-ERU12]
MYTDESAGTTSARPRTRAIVAIVAAIVFLVDQATKIISLAALEYRQPVEVLGDWVVLFLTRNPGAAFSIGTNATWIFTTVQIVFVIGAAYVANKLPSRAMALAVGLIGGGTAGNLLDRLFREPGFYIGHVVDFISVRGFAVFNIADSAITIGVILLIGLLLFEPADVDVAEAEAAEAEERRDA